MNKENEEICAFCNIPLFERNKYYYGKLMTADDYRLEQCYFNRKRWLINKMTIGSGVVCGLDVVNFDDDLTKVIVKRGMAIDCAGREIVVCEDQEVKLIPEEDPCKQKGGQASEADPVMLDICIEFRECESHQVKIKPAICDRDDPYEFNHIRDSFEIHVYLHDEGEGEESSKTYCPLDEKVGLPEGTGNAQIAEIEGKTLQQYLCEEISEECPDSPYAPCVHLATVTVEPVNSSYQVVVDTDDNVAINNCGDNRRKLVYSNALLYDLIHCFHGDLPHIIDINWWQYHGEDVAWGNFVDLINAGFEVTFDTEMAPETINRFTFLFSVITTGTKAGYRKREYVYLETVEKSDTDNNKFTITLDENWIVDELGEKGYSMLKNETSLGFDVEIILRGSHIMSKDGKALDGDFIGGKLPSGNGTQGGDFVSWFHVQPPETTDSSTSRKPKGNKKSGEQKDQKED